jgi:membrane-bound metal-dependent hydrolase YbcI (DUF457 family)
VDPFSHYMIPYIVGRKANISVNKMRAVTLAGVIPDIDSVSIVFGLEAFKDFHGGPVHSILVGLILALIIALGFYLYTRENVLLWSIIGVFFHLLLDIPNTLNYELSIDGLRYLWPFSDYKIALQNVVPYPEAWHLVILTLIFGFSMVYFLVHVRKGEYAWRIWFNENKLFGKKEDAT